jgi:Na+-translocating ferredoxin:NAD+ oxidoreductase RnfE subunit
MIILCFVNTFYFRVRYHDDERLVTSDSNSKVTTRAISEERFRNIVIAAHMTTNFCDLVLNTVWYFYSLHLTYESLSICIYLVVAFAVIIFVTESRVRKHAVVVTMVRTENTENCEIFKQMSLLSPNKLI